MLCFPKGFVKVKYPGYVWDTVNKKLYSYKIYGELVELKVRPAYRGPCKWTGKMLDLSAGFKISVGGQRKLLTFPMLAKLEENVYKEEFIEFKKW